MSTQAAKHPVLFAESGDFDGFLEAFDAGATLSQAAEAVGYKWPTIKRMIEQRPELAERFIQAYEGHRQEKTDKILTELHERGFDRKDPKSAQILLRLAEKYDPEMRKSIEVRTAPIAAQTHRQMNVDMGEIAKVLVDAGVRLTLEPAEERNGPAPEVPRPALLPARTDP